MLLDKLVFCITSIQTCIKRHYVYLSGGELRSRVALIDPLLSALGWDVSDPARVILGYSPSQEWDDYVLLGDGGKPIAIFEVKKLGEIFSESHRLRILNYAISKGIKYAGLSNGNCWELYDVFKTVSLVEKKILDVSIVGNSVHHTALQLLCLWRSNLGSGNITKPNPPILRSSRDSTPVEKWISLAEYKAPPKTRVPSIVRFWGNRERELKFWKDLLKLLAELLYKDGFLTYEDIPYPRSRNRYIVNTEPQHANGIIFLAPYYIEGTPLVVETNMSAKYIRHHCVKLLEDFGKDPNTDLLFKIY